METESAEDEFFRAELGSQHEVLFLGGLDETPADAEALSVFIHSDVTADFVAKHPALRLILTRSTGYDHIALEAARARGITVCNVPSYGENTVAEHSFALLLAISRRLRESLTAYSGRRFSYEALRGFDLMGKTIGIVGTGRIGLHAVRIARGFQMEVLAYDVKTQPLVAATLDFEYVAFEELLRRSDVVSLYVPLLPETRRLINRETLALCKQGVVLINTARGALVDTDALLDALESGQVGGAGLDVLEDERVLQRDSTQIIGGDIVSHIQRSTAPEPIVMRERVEELRGLVRNSRLLERGDVIFTPHSAFNSHEAVERIAKETMRNIRQFLAGRPVNVVEQP
ncbi:MAG TPA: NAD(P)-dependent oxidoreductase [Chthoniobacteraceae bacterium]|nr:NAD(P)-dependent oxidoreductase [Chthoniobacteraceae bacterium]